jgi:hypothetical protein
MTQLFDINNKKLVTNRIGRQYWIWGNDKLYEQRMARENGPYQARNLVMNRRLLPNARTIIDIGGNIGMNAIEYATWCHTASKKGHQIAHIIIRQIDLKRVHDAGVIGLRGIDSDHRAKNIRLKLAQNLKRRTAESKAMPLSIDRDILR